MLALTAIVLVSAYGMFGCANPIHFLIGAIGLLAAFALTGGLLALIWRILKAIPAFYLWVMACAVPVLALLALAAMSVSIGIVASGLGALIVASLFGAGVAGVAGGAWRRASKLHRALTLGALVLGMTGLIAGGAWLLDAGTPLTYPPNVAAQINAQIEPLDLPDPSQPGPYAVHILSYGSGQDRHRSEYGAGVHLSTRPVDGSALVSRWSGLRAAYWGFGPDALPLNGRVWYPEGRGPFPLVVIVHGQHPMEDDSDPGYGYLGELLASRGLIAVSVDENFLNLSPLVNLLILSSLEEEDDLRGWLLLEHLQQWRAWNDSPGNPFYQKVDLGEIALVGHSRGGEAVAVAAALNRLSYYPDDATVRLNYGLDIRSVVALAPVDGQYKPAGQGTLLEDVNYLVLQGSHDMDVSSFQGAAQYERVSFSGAGDWFKAGLYIYGANHGQFNTGWGRKDLFEPVMRLFNLEQLLPAEQQRQIAKVYVSAFLEATLHGQDAYQSLFRDPRRGRAWLPSTIYLSQYADTKTQLVSTYEEDIDLGTTTLAGGTQEGENLTIWREQPVEAKWGNVGDQAVYLGWDAAVSQGQASYTITLPERGVGIRRDTALVFALADANEDPAPHMYGKSPGVEEPIDLTVEVVDGAGVTARLLLSRFSLLQPQLEAKLGKAAFMSPVPTSEAIFQHFEYPMADFVGENPALDLTDLRQIRLIFDRTPAGVVAFDDLGFRN